LHKRTTLAWKIYESPRILAVNLAVTYSREFAVALVVSEAAAELVLQWEIFSVK